MYPPICENMHAFDGTLDFQFISNNVLSIIIRFWMVFNRLILSSTEM